GGVLRHLTPAQADQALADRPDSPRAPRGPSTGGKWRRPGWPGRPVPPGLRLRSGPAFPEMRHAAVAPPPRRWPSPPAGGALSPEPPAPGSPPEKVGGARAPPHGIPPG